MQKTNKYLMPCALAGAAVFLYLQLFIFPDLPTLPSGDQTIFFCDARRMLEGQVLYRDFFQFLFPGIEFVYFRLFKLFGVHAWLTNGVLVLLGVGFVWTSTIISRKLFSGASAILPGFLFVAIPFRNAEMDTGGHHWYSALAVMAALAVLIDARSPRRLAVAGALCGVSAWFNQTRGPAGLLGFTIFLLWEKYQTKESWRSLLARLGSLYSGFFVTLLALTSYFVWKAGLDRFLSSTVVFVLKYYPQSEYNGWSRYGADMPPLTNWYSTTPLGTWLLIELLVPWAYVLLFWRAWRERKTHPREPWDRLALISITGLSLFLGVAPSASNTRLCTVSLPAFILLVWFARSLGRFGRWGPRVLGIGLLALMIAETHSIQTRWHGTLDLPIGRTACFGRDSTQDLEWFLAHRRPTDFLFANPEWNFALGLANPTPLDSVDSTDYTRPEQVQSVVAGLEANHARWVVWQHYFDIPHGASDHLGPLRDYLHSHYRVVKTFENGDVQILERTRELPT